MLTVPPYNGDDPRKLFHTLNSGPNLRGVTNAKHDGNLPVDWNLSFGRVAPSPLQGDIGWFTRLTASAFTDFESACAQLLRSPELGPVVRRQILADVGTDQATRETYLSNPVPFQVRRLDIVMNQHGPAVCENDEMPGGLVHAYWLDRAYGVNQRRWDRALHWLTGGGSLVFAVSTEWSAPYVQEITWFVQHLQQRGFDAHVVTSNQANKLKVRRGGVFLRRKKIGTVWRLFPVFEAHEAFAHIVTAAHEGKVRLAPQLASWGNKAWMGVFWEQRGHFRRAMSPEAYTLLSQLIPYTRLVREDGGFPSAIRSQGELVRLDDMDALRGLPQRFRKQVVVKMTGAHDKAARSYGVMIGTSASGTRWGEGLTRMFGVAKQLAVQEYRPPLRVNVPIWSMLSGEPVLENPFTGKLLVRPWVIGGRLVSATAFLTVPDTTKLHGTTSGGEIPIDFG